MVMTVMSVATPMVSPSIVSEARSLCARKALKHCTRLSRAASIGLDKTPPLYRFLRPRTTSSRAIREWSLSEYEGRGAGVTEPGSVFPDSLRFSRTEGYLFSVWTGAAPVWSVARPLHSGRLFEVGADPGRLLMSCLLFRPSIHARFQSSLRHARNFRAASVWPELVYATASRGITSGARPTENASITSVRVTVALPPLLPIPFRVLARASQSAAQSLRSPLPCCPPAPHRRRAPAEKLYARDRACLALSLRRKLPLA